MRKNGALYKFLMAIGFVAFLGGAFMTLNVSTSRCAEAQIMCTAIGMGVSEALTWVETGVTEFSLTALKNKVIAYFTSLKDAFVNIVTNFTNLVKMRVGDTIDTGWTYNMLPALQARTDQLNTINTQGSQALAGFDDARSLNRVRRELQDMELRSAQEQKPSENVCIAASVTGGIMRAESLQRAYVAAAPAERIARSGNSTTVPLTRSRAEDVKARFGDVTSRYCDGDENGGKAGCTTAPYASQDVDVSGLIFGRETIDMTSPNVKRSVDDLITNIAEPFIRDVVPPSAVDSPEGQRALLNGRSYNARRQVIHDGLYFVVGQGLPGAGMGDAAKALRQSAGIPPELIAANPSIREVKHAMVERFQNGKFAVGQIDEPTNNERELVLQEVFQLLNLSDMIDAKQRENMMLSSQLGTEVSVDKNAVSTVSGVPLE